MKDFLLDLDYFLNILGITEKEFNQNGIWKPYPASEAFNASLKKKIISDAEKI